MADMTLYIETHTYLGPQISREQRLERGSVTRCAYVSYLVFNCTLQDCWTIFLH